MKEIPLTTTSSCSSHAVHPTDHSFDAQLELEKLAYAISHDLQTSVRHVSGFSELLVEEVQVTPTDPQRIQQLAQTLQMASESLRTRLSAILRYSRIGRWQLSWQMVSLRDIWQECLRQKKLEVEARKISIKTEGLDHWFPSDPSLLRQLVEILLDNAIRFTRQVATPQVSFRVAPRDNEAWVLTCQDNGVGFDEQRYERMFDLFSVIHSRTEYPHTGEGTGLALARRIVQRLVGRISGESLSPGACFTVVLPYLDQIPQEESVPYLAYQ